MQERFHVITPALSKYTGCIVAITLMVIGGLGVKESVAEEDEPSAEGR